MTLPTPQLKSMEKCGGSVGIGFAVASQTVTNITAQLLASGRATHPWMGMSTTEISPAAAASLGSVPGLFVQALATSGPAAAAGLHPGDVITSCFRSSARLCLSLPEERLPSGWLRPTVSVRCFR